MNVEEKSTLGPNGHVVPKSYAFTSTRLQPEYARYGGPASSKPKQLIYGEKTNVFPLGRTIQVPPPRHPTQGSDLKSKFTEEQLAFYKSRRDREHHVAFENSKGPLARIEATFTERLERNAAKKAQHEREVVRQSTAAHLPDGFVLPPEGGYVKPKHKKPMSIEERLEAAAHKIVG
jgi:hypothetical protein